MIEGFPFPVCKLYRLKTEEFLKNLQSFRKFEMLKERKMQKNLDELRKIQTNQKKNHKSVS